MPTVRVPFHKLASCRSDGESVNTFTLIAMHCCRLATHSDELKTAMCV